MHDSQVVEGVLSGNAELYELLVLKYQKQIYHSVISIVKVPEVAEEIVQEAFIKAYEKLPTLKNHAGYYSWLKRIAINMSLNQFDRSKWMVDLTTEDGENDFFDSIPVNDTPEDKLIKQELGKYLNMFIDSLPDKLRIVLVMREIEDMSYEDISEILDIPLGTVRSRLFNARKILKERLLAQGLADGLYSLG